MTEFNKMFVIYWAVWVAGWFVYQGATALLHIAYKQWSSLSMMSWVTVHAVLVGLTSMVELTTPLIGVGLVIAYIANLDLNRKLIPTNSVLTSEMHYHMMWVMGLSVVCTRLIVMLQYA